MQQMAVLLCTGTVILLLYNAYCIYMQVKRGASGHNLPQDVDFVKMSLPVSGSACHAIQIDHKIFSRSRFLPQDSLVGFDNDNGLHQECYMKLQ